MITFASVAISLTISLVPLAYGQTETQQKQKESLQALLDYCFQHADHPNPLQDLIDKGLLSETFTRETCKSVKQTYDLLEIEISEYNKNLTAGYENRAAEFEEKARRQFEYMECAQNQTTTYEECERILNGTK